MEGGGGVLAESGLTQPMACLVAKGRFRSATSAMGFRECLHPAEPRSACDDGDSRDNGMLRAAEVRNTSAEQVARRFKMWKEKETVPELYLPTAQQNCSRSSNCFPLVST